MRPDNPTVVVTADDVAELAGVSRWTVNRAYKEQASISAKSRRKVLDAAEHLGYAPDLLAAGLASNRSGIVSLLVNDFSNPHTIQLLEHLTRVLRQHSWGTLLINNGGEQDASAALLNASQHRVDAAVLMGTSFDDVAIEAALGARRVRKLILFGRLSSNPNTLSICCDDHKAMTDIADHIISRGYRSPLFMAGPQTSSAPLLRKQAFIERWRKKKKGVVRSTVVEHYDSRMAEKQLERYLAATDRSNWPDVVVCENDTLAIGAMDAIRHRFNLQVPEDIAVTGFDNIASASNPNYELTTYSQPSEQMADALISILKGEGTLSNYSDFEGTLFVRRSC
ncbi:MAG: LacI family transcriptional regulator [Gammaproteobacteria bacterium]|nr:LacI family transcriptional regulator [Gammaproteobacteria bacterium]